MLIQKDKILFLICFLLSLGLSFFIFYSYYGTNSFHFPYHDSLAFVYPNIFYVQNTIRQGIMPLWDPWTRNGMPLALNITFYNISPILLFFSLFGPFSFEIFKIETFFIQSICFIGMFLWLRLYVNKWIALYGAFCFSVSPVIVGTITDTSALTTMSMVPLLVYSLKKTLEGSWRSAGLLAFFLLIIFSSGYLGLNILFLPFIFLFCYLDFFLIMLQGDLKNRLITIIFASAKVIVALLLFWGITNFQWLQAWDFTKFQTSDLHIGWWSPFDGGNRLKFISTLFFVRPFPPFITQYVLVPEPGETTMLYIGIFNLCLVIFTIFYKKYLKQTLLILSFVVFIFLISLTGIYPTARIAVAIIPFLRLSRWHGWYDCLIIFFTVTLACLGLKILYEKFSKAIMKKLLISQIIVLALFLCTIAVLLVKASYTGSFISLPLITLLLLIGTTIYFSYFNALLKIKKILIIFILVGLGLLEFVPTAFHYFVYRDIFVQKSVNRKGWRNTVSLMESQAKDGFTYSSNERKDSIDQFITNIPTSDGYSPVRTVTMQLLLNKVGEKEYQSLTHYMLYFPGKSNKPNLDSLKSISNIELRPNSLSAVIESKKNNQDVIWSSSYTPYWKLEVNGHLQLTQQAKFGFTSFSIHKGVNKILLIYHPYYLERSILIQILSLILLVYFLIFGKLPHKIKFNKIG